jgi:hypothetical protein
MGPIAIRFVLYFAILVDKLISTGEQPTITHREGLRPHMKLFVDLNVCIVMDRYKFEISVAT